MAIETTQVLVWQSYLSTWRLPSRRLFWPSVGYGLRMQHTSEGMDLAAGFRRICITAVSKRARNHCWVRKEMVGRQVAIRSFGHSSVSACRRDLKNALVLRSNFACRAPHPWFQGAAELLVARHRGKVGELRRSACTEAWLGRHSEEGDWQFSPEWWGTQGGSWGRNTGDIVFESQSSVGNGLISVTLHPSSRPEEWTAVERELQQRQVKEGKTNWDHGLFKVLGYQWRVLRFNTVTRQSVAKVMVVSNENTPSKVFLIQQPNCIAFEYVKSMLSVGLSTMSLAGFSLEQVTQAKKEMRILCIGLGGGSLPVFLAHNLTGARLDVVEIDVAVIKAAMETMGFPRCEHHVPRSQVATHTSVQSQKSGVETHVHLNGGPAVGNNRGQEHDMIQDVLWGSTLRRLTVYEADAASFVEDLGQRESKKEPSSRQYYDMVFVDAYDGEDVVPTKLWARSGSFLTSLSHLLHPKHGTVVVNLHTDAPPPSLFEKATGQYGPGFDPSLPQGKEYKRPVGIIDALLSSFTGTGPAGGTAFTLAVPSQGNVSLVVSRGVTVHNHAESRPRSRNSQTEQILLEKLKAESKYVQKLLNLQLDLQRRVSRGFQVVAERVKPAAIR